MRACAACAHRGVCVTVAPRVKTCQALLAFDILAQQLATARARALAFTLCALRCAARARAQLAVRASIELDAHEAVVRFELLDF